MNLAKQSNYWRSQKRDPKTGRWIDATPGDVRNPKVPTAGRVQMRRSNVKPAAPSGYGMGGKPVDLPKYNVVAGDAMVGEVYSRLSTPKPVSEGGGSSKLWYSRHPGSSGTSGPHASAISARDALLKDLGHDNAPAEESKIPAPKPAGEFDGLSDAAMEKLEPMGGESRKRWWAEMERRGLRGDTPQWTAALNAARELDRAGVTLGAGPTSREQLRADLKVAKRNRAIWYSMGNQTAVANADKDIAKIQAELDTLPQEAIVPSSSMANISDAELDSQIEALESKITAGGEGERASDLLGKLGKLRAERITRQNVAGEGIGGLSTAELVRVLQSNRINNFFDEDVVNELTSRGIDIGAVPNAPKRTAAEDMKLFKPGSRVDVGGRAGTVISINPPSTAPGTSDWPIVVVQFDDDYNGATLRSSLLSYTLDPPTGTDVVGDEAKRLRDRYAKDGASKSLDVMYYESVLDADERQLAFKAQSVSTDEQAILRRLEYEFRSLS